MGAEPVIAVPDPHAAPDPAARLPRFFGAGDDLVARLAARTLAVVGLGSVGFGLAQHAGRIGIGHLVLIDRGLYKSESLLTHPLPPAGVGRPKATYAGEYLRVLAPGTQTTIHQGAFQDLPLDALVVDGAPVDLVVLAVDNLATELAVAEICLHLGIPIVQCSVGGSLLVAQVRAFTGGPAGAGPCVACQFSAAEWHEMSNESTYSCDGSVTARARALAPTRSPASLCSLAADLGLHRVIRHFLGLGAPLTDELLEYRGYTDALVSTPLLRNESCPVDHRRWRILPRGDDVRTLGAAVASAGFSGPCTVQVDGTQFVAEAACGGGTWQAVGRFVTSLETLGPCAECGGPLVPSPFHSHVELVVAADLAAVGVPSGRAIVVRSRSGETAMLTPQAQETKTP
jgi:molybdopterin/thiamine biosynthesis adenylyltransferase